MATSSDRITSRLRGLGVGIDLVHLTNGVGEVHARQVGGGEELVVPSGGDAADAARTAWNRLAGRHGRYRAVVCFGGPQAMAPAPVYAAWLGAPLVTLLRGNDFETGVFSPRRSVLVDALRSSRVVATVSRDMAQRVGLLLGGLGASPVFPLMFTAGDAAAQRLGRPAGTGGSLVSAASRLGFLSSPVLVGFVAERLDLVVALAITPLGALLMLATLPRMLQAADR